MAKIESDLLGFRASQYYDVSSLAKLRDYFEGNENFSDADRVDIEVKDYASRWENASAILSGEFRQVYYNYDSNTWHNVDDNTFAQNPAFNDAFSIRARELNLLSEQ